MDSTAMFAKTTAARLATILAPLRFDRAIFFEHARDDEQGFGERLSCARFVINSNGHLERWPQRWQSDLPGAAEWLRSDQPWTDDLDAIADQVIDAVGQRVGDLVSVRQLRQAGIRALLATAVYQNDEAIGSLVIGSTIPAAFGPTERDLLRSPAIASLLRDVVAALAARRRDVLRQMREMFEPDMSIAALAATLATALATENDWDFVGIYRVEQQFEMVASCDRTDGQVLKIDASYRQDLDVGMLGRTLQARECLRADDVTTTPPPYDYTAVEGFEARSALCYPIFVSGKVEWLIDCSSTALAAFRGPDRNVLDELVEGLQVTLNLWFETRLSAAILDGLTEAVVVTDRDGCIQRSNSAGRALFGLVEGKPVPLMSLAMDDAGRRLLNPARALSSDHVTLMTAMNQPRDLIVTARLSSEAFGQFVFKFSDKGEREWLAGLAHAREIVETEVGRTRAVLMLAGALVARVRADLKAGRGLDTADASLLRVSEAIAKTNLSYDRLAGATAGRLDSDRSKLIVDTIVGMATAALSPDGTAIATGTASRALTSALTKIARHLAPNSDPAGTP